MGAGHEEMLGEKLVLEDEVRTEAGGRKRERGGEWTSESANLVFQNVPG